MTKGTQGRSAGGVFARRFGRSLPVALLTLSLGIAGFGALAAFQAQRSHQDTATALLQDYSEFAAWSYERNTWDMLRQSIDSHLAIAYANSQFAQGHAAEACLQLILTPDGCDCEYPLAGSYSFFTRLGEPVSESVWVGSLPGSMHQTLVVEETQRHARDAYAAEWQFAVLHVEDTEAAPIIAYTLLESPVTLGADLSTRRDTVLYGFEIDPGRLAALYAGALDDEVLLPPTLTSDRLNSDVMQVAVVGPAGSVLYESDPGAEMAFAATVERQPVFGGGAIRASVVPEVAGELIIGGLPSDRTGVLTLIFSLAGALAVMAIVQLRREDQLALLRQDFVASVSHELRTPLAQVRLFTETLLLKRTRTEDQRAWALDNIDRETRRLSNLVENILHFSRAERGAQHLDLEPADLSEGVRRAIESFRPLLPSRRGTLEASLEPGLYAEVHSDSIRQVILNLLDNAVRYGREGQTIVVSCHRTPGGVRVSVADEGPGVPPDERERIFEPFQRGTGAVGTVVVGSGIGLAVVHQLIDAHQGRIWVDDAESGGARFSFELPLACTARSDHFEASIDASSKVPTEAPTTATGAA